jgi:type I site-specific restriction endonuclease
LEEIMQEQSDEVIYGYTGQQAIEDGVLVDVTNTPEAILLPEEY